jgi:hypothetical protein
MAAPNCRAELAPLPLFPLAERAPAEQAPLYRGHYGTLRSLLLPPDNGQAQLSETPQQKSPALAGLFVISGLDQPLG